MTSPIRQDRLFLALSFSLGLLPATLVGVKGAYGIATVLILLLSIAGLVRLAREGQLDWRATWRRSAPIALPFCGFFLAFVLSVVATRDSWRGLDYPNRWILLLPVLGVLVAARDRIDYRHFWTGVAIGSVLTGLVASYQVYGLGYGRAQGFTAANPYGNLSILLGLLCGVAALYQRNRPLRGALLALAGWGGMWASLLSTTRGGWPLVLPFVVLLAIHLSRLPRRAAVGMLLTHVVLVTLAYPTVVSHVSQRINDIGNDLSIADSHKKSESSVGARLAMWKMSFQMWQEHPVFGIGPTRFKDELHRKNTEQYKSGDIYTQNVAHHEWLDVMARAGSFGAFALAALYASPLVGLYRRRAKLPAWRSPGGLGVVAFIGAFGLFGLTNTTLTNHPSLLFFIVALSVMWAQYLRDIDAAAPARVAA